MLLCVLLPPEVPAPALAERLLAVAPLVERQGSVVFVDVRGTGRLHGGPAGLFAAARRALAPQAPRGLGLAAHRFTAEMAARHGRGPVSVGPGEEALFLSRLPLAVLPLPPGLARRLHPLGLETLGDFASLPVAAIEARYGPQAVALHRLARGEDETGLLPDRADVPPEALVDLDEPVDRLERLAPFLERALEALAGSLWEHDRGVLRLALTLHLEARLEADDPGAAIVAEPSAGARRDGRGGGPEEGPGSVGSQRSKVEGPGQNGVPEPHRLTLAPAAPEARPVLLLELLLLRLAENPPPRPVRRLHLQVLESAPLGVHQNALFGEVARDAARRAEALSRLATAFGEQAVDRPRLRPAHRVEARWESAASGAARGGEAKGPGLGSTGGAAAASPARSAPGRAAERAPASGAASGFGAAGVRARRPAGTAGDRSSRRPDGERDPRPRPPLALRLLGHPEELVPIVASGRLVGFRRGREALAVARLGRPRRLEGGWWSSAPWARDEFDLQTGDGALYRVCRDMVTRRWLLLGELG